MMVVCETCRTVGRMIEWFPVGRPAYILSQITILYINFFFIDNKNNKKNKNN